MKQENKRGIALIVAVSIMVLLSLMAVTFVKISNYEQAAASNYSGSIHARLTAMAGIERATAVIMENLRTTGGVPSNVMYPHAPGSIYYNLRKASAERQQLSLYEGSTASFSYSGLVGYPSGANIIGTYEQQGNLYALKIVNLASKINVNSHRNSGSPGISNRIIFQILRSLAGYCNISASETDAIARAIRPDDSNAPPYYYSMEDVLQKIKSICTTSSETARQQFYDNLCVNSWIDPTTSVVQSNPADNPPTYFAEHRAPVDINSASSEVLKALIVNIRATATFWEHSTASSEDPNYEETGNPDQNAQTETSITHTQKNAVIDFSSTGTNVGAIVTALTNNRPYNHRVELDNIIDNPAVSAIPDDYLPDFPSSVLASETQASWYKACRDALKSNFNPNTIDNFWHPNMPLYRSVAKSNLYNASGQNHTTELCFQSNGRFEITSLGRITAENNAVIAGYCTMRTEIQFSDIMVHTTQADFKSTDSSFSSGATETISYPETHNNINSGVSSADINAGYVEPKPFAVSPITSNATAAYEPDFTSDPLLSSQIERCQNYPKMERKRMRPTSSDYLDNNVGNDGIFSRIGQYSGTYTDTGNARRPRYYGVQSIQNGMIEGRSSSSDNYYNGTNGTSRVGNYRGSLEFWVRLDIDGSEKMECGLFSVTQISREQTGKESIKFKEGTQTYLFKNTSGQLRLSRIYFCGYFDASNNYYGSEHSKDGDSQRTFAKRDVIVDISGWKAHTWHHVFVKWNDEHSDVKHTLKMWLDGTEHQAKHYIGDKATTDKPQFCILNDTDTVAQTDSGYSGEKHGMDGILLNGFYRRQYSLSGSNVMFKHSQEVHFIGNATMDKVVSYAYLDTRNSQHEHDIEDAARNRYSTNATYTNTFAINKKGILGTLAWTAYPARPSSPSATDKPYLKCSASIRNASNSEVARYDYQNVSSDSGYYGAGLAPNGIVSVSPGYKVIYTVTFYTPSQSTMAADTTLKGGICASLDDVRLHILNLQHLTYENVLE